MIDQFQPRPLDVALDNLISQLPPDYGSVSEWASRDRASFTPASMAAHEAAGLGPEVSRTWTEYMISLGYVSLNSQPAPVKGVDTPLPKAS